MKIVQINASDIQGGAAIAAYRLHQGLKQIGTDCLMLVKDKVSKYDTVLKISPENSGKHSDRAFFLSEVIQGHYINTHRTDISNTFFSLPYPGFDLSRLSVVQDADVINLHWVAYYQSPITLNKLFALGKPVVWTLHDQWAFTGGCHYSGGCDKYQDDCAACPQLADDPFDLAASILKDKVELFKGANLTIVSPSKWLATCAQKSRLFKDLRIEVIANPLDTEVYRPMDKAGAKAKLNISSGSTTILFGAENNNEKRKGFNLLIEAIRQCLSSNAIQDIVKNNKLNILCFGHPSPELKEIDIPKVSLGYLNTIEQIQNAYAAADIFVLPSLEDNLPNTLIESSSCGVPAVAFDVGGIPDVLSHGETGLLTQAGNTRQMGEAIKSLIADPKQRALMGKKARSFIIEKCAVNTRSHDYYSLFSELQKNKRSSGTTTETHNQSNIIGNNSRDLSVYLNADSGPHFQKIYEGVLIKALKEYAILIQKKLRQCEKDNMKLSTSIYEYTRILQSLRKSFLYKLSELIIWLKDRVRFIIKSVS